MTYLAYFGENPVKVHVHSKYMNMNLSKLSEYMIFQNNPPKIFQYMAYWIFDLENNKFEKERFPKKKKLSENDKTLLLLKATNYE